MIRAAKKKQDKGRGDGSEGQECNLKNEVCDHTVEKMQGRKRS